MLKWFRAAPQTARIIVHTPQGASTPIDLRYEQGQTLHISLDTNAMVTLTVGDL